MGAGQRTTNSIVSLQVELNPVRQYSTVTRSRLSGGTGAWRAQKDDQSASCPAWCLSAAGDKMPMPPFLLLSGLGTPTERIEAIAFRTAELRDG
ncbi:hypothetical protein AOLI_G00032640 [Acnodon oligacanthus]